MRRPSGLAAVACVLVFASACSSSGAGGRAVQITQHDDGCTPASVDVTPGERLNLVIKNDSTHDPYEIEGTDGAKFEELNVPEGRSRSAGYTVPDGGDIHKLKCYIPGGVSTIIELRSGGTGAATAASSSAGASSTASGGNTGSATPGSDETHPVTVTTQLKQPDVTVAVALASYSVTPDKTSVKAGTIRFVATNTSPQQVHEFAVLRLGSDGSLDKVDEIDGIDPEQAQTLTLDLTPGSYQLACLIAPGEHGSAVDHYQQGMHTSFAVQ